MSSTEFVRTYIERQVSGSWSDISAYVVGDLSYEYLIPENSANELLASVGELEMVVNNKTGLFSPSPVFHRGTPIRVTTIYDGTAKVRFLGTIMYMDADTLEWGDQFIRVTCRDWLNYTVDFPITIPTIMVSGSVNSATNYLLSLMSNQPESVAYGTPRESFGFIFNDIKKETKLYTELNKLALSEYAPIYVRGGNNLVIESANTRAGTRELTTIPTSPSQAAALLVSSGGTVLCTAGGIPILASSSYAPNLISGTVQPIDIEIDEEAALSNRVTITAHPVLTDPSPVKLFELAVSSIFIPTFGTRTINGTWADLANGGLPINASSIVHPIVTGTNWQFYSDKSKTNEISTQLLLVSEQYGANDFAVTFFNNGNFGYLGKLDIFGYGLYPFNPLDTVVSVTGSIATYGISEMKFDQKYQDDVNVAHQRAEIIADEEKEPRNRLVSIAFDASSSPKLMQASQYIDTGDLVYVKNVKPVIDTYAYLDGKQTIITPAGQVTEKWYLREMDSLRKGLSSISLKFSGLVGSQNGVDFGRSSVYSDLPQKTVVGWIKNVGAAGTVPLLSLYDGLNGWYFNQTGPGKISFRQNFTPNDGEWSTVGSPLSGSAGAWHHIAVTYDRQSAGNDPSFYLDGLLLSSQEDAAPAGTADTEVNAKLVLGNLNFPSFQFIYNHNGYFKDCRIYNRILSTTELAEIVNNQGNPLTVQNGLVFQAPTVKTEDYGILTGTILYPTNKLIDNVYGFRGTPNWNMPSGTVWALKAYDPNS